MPSVVGQKQWDCFAKEVFLFPLKNVMSLDREGILFDCVDSFNHRMLKLGPHSHLSIGLAVTNCNLSEDFFKCAYN